MKNPVWNQPKKYNKTAGVGEDRYWRWGLGFALEKFLEKWAIMPFWEQRRGAARICESKGQGEHTVRDS